MRPSETSDVAGRADSSRSRLRRWAAGALTVLILGTYAEPGLAPFIPPKSPPPISPPSGASRVIVIPETQRTIQLGPSAVARFNELSPTQQRVEAYRSGPSSGPEMAAGRRAVAQAAALQGIREDAVSAFLVAELVPPESARAVAARALGLPARAPSLGSPAQAALGPLGSGQSPFLRYAAGVAG
jgi:hypothetical protein